MALFFLAISSARRSCSGPADGRASLCA